uniref:Endophilin-A2 n=1 Tax=Cyprinus carpio TaxID=7962 RepID=A0A8C1XAD2_CYPCA
MISLIRLILKESFMMSEKVGGAEGTKLDEDFKDLEKKADVTSKAISDVLCKTAEYLQPNPASRARLTMVNTMSKMRGQVKSPGYPQAEGLLGECMLKYGRDMGEDTNFGGALVEMGEAMKRLAEVKDSLDIDVKQNFIDPFQTIVDKDLKDIQHHLKKLEGRRLDYDYKKKRQGKIPDEELKLAAEKFEESKEVAETSMQNLLDTDPVCVCVCLCLHAFVFMFVYVLCRVNKAQSQPRQKRMPASRPSFDCLEPEDSNGGWSPSAAPSSSPSTAAPSFNRASSRQKRNMTDQPCCKALYDFEAENDGELGFYEGDVITLTNQIDENWFEGTVHGQTGLFPCNYVEVMVPLRH